MQGMNRLKLQPLLANVEPFDTRLQDALLLAIQAPCAAGSRKVASRAEIFQVLTCSEAGEGRDIAL